MLKRLLLFLALLTLANPAQAAFVNITSTPGTSGSSTTAATPAFTVTTGNLIVVFVGWIDTPGTITAAVTDSASNSYTAGTKLRNSGTGASQMFYAYNVTGGSVTVTATFSTATTFRTIIASQYSNIAAGDPLDSEVTPVTGNSAAPLTGTFATTVSNEFVVGAMAGGAPLSPNSGYTMHAAIDFAGLEDGLFSSATSGLTAGFTSPSETWNMHAMVFKLASTEVSTNISRSNVALFYSPYTWHDDGTSINANSTGSYVKFTFNGTGLQVNTVALGTPTASSAADGCTTGNGYPWIRTYIDNSPAVDTQLNGSTNYTLASGLSAGNHTAVIVVSRVCPNPSPGGAWTLTNSVKITSFGAIGGSTASAYPTLRSKRAILYGDSLIQGVRVFGTTPVYPDGMDGTATVAPLIAEALDTEIGQLGYGGTGFNQAYDGVPALNTAYSSYSNGVSRLSGGLFSPAPDYVISMHGVNGTVLQSDVATFIANARAAAPLAWIVMIVPPGGFHRTEITAAVTAARVAGDLRVITVDAGVGSYQSGCDGAAGVVSIGAATEQCADTIHPWARTDARLAAEYVRQIQLLTGASATSFFRRMFK